MHATVAHTHWPPQAGAQTAASPSPHRHLTRHEGSWLVCQRREPPWGRGYHPCRNLKRPHCVTFPTKQMKKMFKQFWVARPPMYLWSHKSVYVGSSQTLIIIIYRATSMQRTIERKCKLLYTHLLRCCPPTPPPLQSHWDCTFVSYTSAIGHAATLLSSPPQVWPIFDSPLSLQPYCAGLSGCSMANRRA
jgi:hypothetical protein